MRSLCVYDQIYYLFAIEKSHSLREKEIYLTFTNSFIKFKGEKKEIKKQIEEGGVALLKAFRALPKNKALIKYLSEPGIRAHLQKTENYYLQDQGKEMKKIDADLFFTIDEKNNSIEILDKGIDLISGEEDPTFYIMPDIGTLVADIENSGKSESEQLKMKDSMLRDYQVKGERIHTMINTPFDQLTDRTGSIQQAVVTVAMQMSEGPCSHEPLFLRQCFEGLTQ